MIDLMFWTGVIIWFTVAFIGFCVVYFLGYLILEKSYKSWNMIFKITWFYIRFKYQLREKYIVDRNGVKWTFVKVEEDGTG